MQRQKQLSRSGRQGRERDGAGAGASLHTVESARRIEAPAGDGKSEFTGYVRLDGAAAVTATDRNALVVKATPFYAESGGQRGDSGELRGGGETYVVIDTQKAGDCIVHLLDRECTLKPGETVELRVDALRRANIASNHTATHLVHEALRRVLGADLHQQGSGGARTALLRLQLLRRHIPERLRRLKRSSRRSQPPSPSTPSMTRTSGSRRGGETPIPERQMFFGKNTDTRSGSWRSIRVLGGTLQDPRRLHFRTRVVSDHIGIGHIQWRAPYRASRARDSGVRALRGNVCWTARSNSCFTSGMISSASSVHPHRRHPGHRDCLRPTRPRCRSRPPG